jgi:membrane protease YdiL (CAAX protease family)
LEPSVARVVFLIARLSLLRSLNRLGNLWRGRKRVPQRGATGRKAAGGKLLLALMALIFAWQTVQTSALLVQRVSRLVEQRQQPDVLVVDGVTFQLLEKAAAHRWGPEQKLDAQGEALLERAAERRESGLSDEDQELRRSELVWLFNRQGMSAFRSSDIPERHIWPSTELWYAGASPFELAKPLMVVAFLLALAQVLQHVAGSDEDLARVGPGLEWLFSFPVRARALFWARAAAAPFSSPLVWVVLLPFYAVVFACAGLGLASIALGALAAVYVALWGGGLRVLLETTLRRYLSMVWVSRVQAGVLTLSLLPLAAGFAVAFSPLTAGALVWAAELPDAVRYEPLTLPLSLAAGGRSAFEAAALGLVLLGAWLFACVGIAERMVRGGITSGASEHVILRGGAAAAISTRGSAWRGVRLKEWRSLVRDRRTRAQAFIAPVLLFTMQFLLNPSLARAIASNPRHVATAAFAVSAFSLTTSAFTAIGAEGPALYWLYTAPIELSRALLDKLIVRSMVSALFGVLIFVVAWGTEPDLILPSLPYAALTFVGIGLYSVIAVGIGTLGTDVLEPEPRRRIRPGGIYLFMMLAALFAYAIYTPSLWGKVVQLMLSALLAYAVWQKLGERLPFLLDPTEAPPPVITVADGVIAALAFFVLQAVFSLPFQDGDQTEALTVLVAFASAGLTVAALALFSFWRSRIPNLLVALGLRRSRERRTGLLAPLGLGVGGGLLAALLALGYLWIMRQVPWLAADFEEAQRSLGELDAAERGWLLGLAVVAAPIFEEFIFRGILYRGFRHSVGPLAAALSSAVVFGLVHPAPTALPVTFMALLAGAAYERTGWLATPVAMHMTYNAVMFGSALWS